MSSINLQEGEGYKSALFPGVTHNVLKPIEMFHAIDHVKAVCYIPRIFNNLLRKSDIIYENEYKFKFYYRRGQTHVDIVAKSQDALQCVIDRINSYISTARLRFRPTHFVCLPIRDNASKEAYLTFKKKVLERVDDSPNYEGITENLFQSEHKLHFTFATLLLADAEEVQLASRLLTDFIESGGEDGSSLSPLRFSVQGLKSMQDDPKQTHVLYATVKEGEDSERLQAIANNISALFTRHGLLNGREGESGVKLHMTLIRTRFPEKTQDQNEGTKPKRTPRQHFCADKLLADFTDYSFTESVLFDDIRLCRFGTTGPDGFYVTEAQVKLGQPNNGDSRTDAENELPMTSSDNIPTTQAD